VTNAVLYRVPAWTVVEDVTDLIKTLAPETFTFPDDVIAAVEHE